jgi:hypothetical protein
MRGGTRSRRGGGSTGPGIPVAQRSERRDPPQRGWLDGSILVHHERALFSRATLHFRSRSLGSPSHIPGENPGPLSPKRASSGMTSSPFAPHRRTTWRTLGSAASPVPQRAPGGSAPGRPYPPLGNASRIQLARSWITSGSTCFTWVAYSSGVAVPSPGVKRWLSEG